MDWRGQLSERIGTHVAEIYGRHSKELVQEVLRLVEGFVEQRVATTPQPSESDLFSERDVVLITYGEQVRAADRPPLSALHAFLAEQGLRDCINTVHLLPFFPYSSDDGFSVIDFREVDPAVGGWEDVERLGAEFRLMFDLVLNHVSQQHDWFVRYLRREEPYSRFFIELDPRTDVSQVTRPRSHPLLTPFQTSRGTRYVWTTFSADQVDLNYAEPQVLLRMLDILLAYIRRGARIIRIDAVAYLWKDVSTSSIHLRQTHEVVKLMRTVAQAAAPGVLLLTETNVPHRENVSYFGAGDEAHMVYQFSLPPLLLDAYLNADGTVFTKWLSELSSPPPGAAYFNFTASHDGIGVRPLEGLVSDERLERLVEHTRHRGGLVSMRRMPDGSERPYELNITYVDAMSPPGEANDVELHARRFLASQAIMLALAGMPAVYFHSLVGTQNDHEGVRLSGHARRINRRKFEEDDLRQRLGSRGSLQARVYRGYRRLLACRVEQPAFHPAAPQSVVEVGDPQVIAFQRTSLDGRQRILIVANLSSENKEVDLPAHGMPDCGSDLLGNATVSACGDLTLAPYEIAWLASVANSVKISTAD